MAHEHSPSGSDKYLIGGESAEIPGISRRKWLAGAIMAAGGLLVLNACGAGETTRKKRKGDGEPDPGGNAPEEENDGEKKYDTYNKLNFDQVYTEVPKYRIEGDENANAGPGVIYVKSGWGRENGRLQKINEPETLESFTITELADRYNAGDVNDGEVRHWLSDTVAAVEYPGVPGLGGLFDGKDYNQDVAIIQVPPLTERRKKAENIWEALGVLGQYAQGLALDIELYDEVDDAGRVSKDDYEKVFWMVCRAVTSNEKAANKLKAFVSERARQVESPEQAEECMNWWTESKLAGTQPVVGAYDDSEAEHSGGNYNRRSGITAVQFFVGDDHTNVIARGADSVQICVIDGTERVKDYSDPDY